MGLFGRACSGGVGALAMMVACGGSSSRQDRPASRASDEPASIPAHLSVFAGVGSRGFGGDDAPALDAMLDGPRGIAVAADGAVYIADTGNNRVRKVRDGVISTVLGHEAAGPNLLDNASGELSIGPSADSWSERLGSWRTDSSACASCPQAVDGNFIFMPDWEYASAGDEASLVQAIDVSQHEAEIEAQGLTFQFSGYVRSGLRPDGDVASVTLTSKDEAGTILGVIYDSGAERTRSVWRKLNADVSPPAGTRTIEVEFKATRGTGAIEAGFDGVTLSVLGASRDATQSDELALQSPTSLALAADKTLFVADTGNGRILKLRPDGKVERVAIREVQSPTSLAVSDDSTLYVADPTQHSIFVLRSDGKVTRWGGDVGDAAEDEPASTAQFNTPTAVAISRSAEFPGVLVVDTGNQKIRRIAPDGTVSTLARRSSGSPTLATSSFLAADLRQPYAIATPPGSGGALAFIVDRHAPLRALAGGGDSLSFDFLVADDRDAPGAPAHLTSIGLVPAGVAADASGSLYVSDAKSNRILKLSCLDHFGSNSENARLADTSCLARERARALALKTDRIANQADSSLLDRQSTRSNCTVEPSGCAGTTGTGSGGSGSGGGASNGTSCTSASECASGYCVDGRCCDTSCNSGSTTDCRSCNLSGSRGTCTYLSAGTQCRAAVAGGCDVAEFCSGTSGSCPANTVKPPGTVCRPSSGACDTQETCNGLSSSCPSDTRRPAGYVCRPSGGLCDLQEVCDGASGSCPSDTIRPEGYICRDPENVPCGMAEFCDGVSKACPENGLLPDGVPCLDDDTCNAATCQAGVCTPGDPQGIDDEGNACCSGSCAGKQCGDPNSDGCFGECTGFCNDGDIGCTRDSDCKRGSFCAVGLGALFGKQAGSNVCMPRDCANLRDENLDCGTPTSKCGQNCPQCVPACEDRECGSDPVCGESCGTCAAGFECSAGKCVAPIPVPSAPTAPGVGAIPGDFSVSGTGSATYSMTLALPPGRASMTPTLSLSYDSSRRADVMGAGWALDGLSYITRCNRTATNIKWGQGVHLDDTDRFCLNGMALYPTDPAGNGLDGMEYRTELDSFTRVVSYGGVASENGITSPTHFKAWTRDGRTYTYGQSLLTYVRGNPSGPKRVWALEKVEDLSGNYIQYAYRADGPETISIPGTPQEIWCSVDASLCSTQEIIPHSIAWGGNTQGLAHDRSVEFFYADSRSDPKSFFSGGAEVKRIHLLDHIEALRRNRGQRESSLRGV